MGPVTNWVDEKCPGGVYMPSVSQILSVRRDGDVGGTAPTRLPYDGLRIRFHYAHTGMQRSRRLDIPHAQRCETRHVCRLESKPATSVR